MEVKRGTTREFFRWQLLHGLNEPGLIKGLVRSFCGLKELAGARRFMGNEKGTARRRKMLQEKPGVKQTGDALEARDHLPRKTDYAVDFGLTARNMESVKNRRWRKRVSSARRFCACRATANAASGRVIPKNGFRFVGYSPDAMEAKPSISLLCPALGWIKKSSGGSGTSGHYKIPPGGGIL